MEEELVRNYEDH